MSSLTNLANDESVPNRLRSHFTDAPASTHASRWDDLWNESFTPWDRGTANPALIDTLSSQTAILGSPVHSSGKRKRALVPGCGKGYDVLVLASFGYDVYGVEASEKAREIAVGFVTENAGKGDYAVRDEKVGLGEMRILYGDFFQDGWVDGVQGDLREEFDLIYDYTFLCALPYELRSTWSKRMSQLLAPTGHLLCLEFPTHKPTTSGGPPFPLPPIVYEELLAKPGEEIRYDGEWKVIPSNPRTESERALVRMAHWQPERTHEVGKGHDWISIWKRK